MRIVLSFIASSEGRTKSSGDRFLDCLHENLLSFLVMVTNITSKGRSREFLPKVKLCIEGLYFGWAIQIFEDLAKETIKEI